MSNLILHPIPHSRQLGQYDTPQQVEQARKDFEEVASTAIDVMKDYLENGYTVLDSWNDSHGGYNIRQFLLHKPDDTTKIVKDMDVVYFNSVEVKSTYSKSHQLNFDYLRCGFGHNKFVNIFDHPDTTRNTWHICENRGWTWENLQDAIMNSYPVTVTLSFDGDWFTLVDIMAKTEYDFMCEVIDTMNGAPDNEETED